MATRKPRNPEAIEILFDSASGIYIPQRFAEECRNWSGVSEEEFAALAAGPNVDSEGYWSTWESVLDSAEWRDADGNLYRLHQDGDVFAYCSERMSQEDQINLFGEV